MYAEALRLRPAFAEARYNLAISQAALGHFADAIESCRVTLETRPTLREARALLEMLQRATTAPLRAW
jgi:Flp pilus assembly protein TadD